MHLRARSRSRASSRSPTGRSSTSPRGVGDRRPERLGQVERHRGRPVGHGRAVAARGPRPDDAGRDLRGRRGIPSRNAAEVEVVLDNSDGGGASEFSEISILRRLDRSGDGEYRLNGARCRMADIIEALSDTGLGKEMHSVVSQGKVEAIIHSKPRDRRLLIEEGRRARQAPQAPPPRAAQARAHRGEPGAGARRRARGPPPPAAAQAPGRGRRAARADRAPVARGPARARPRPRRRCPGASWPPPSRPRPPPAASRRPPRPS